MTTTPSTDRTDVDILAEGLDGTNRQKAEAIAAFVDSRVAAIFGLNHGQLAELAERVKRLYQEHGDRSEVRQAAAAVHDATQDHNQDLGQQTEQTAADDAARTQQATQAVDQAEQRLTAERRAELDHRLGGQGTDEPEGSGSQPEPDDYTRRQVEFFGRVIAPREGSDNQTRLDDIEADVADLRACVTNLERGQTRLQVVTATAYAWARSNDSSNGWRNAAKAALIAFLATFVVYLLFVWIFESIKFDFNWAIGLPGVIAGLVAAFVFMRSDDGDGPDAGAIASSSAITREWERQAAEEERRRNRQENERLAAERQRRQQESQDSGPSTTLQDFFRPGGSEAHASASAQASSH